MRPLTVLSKVLFLSVLSLVLENSLQAATPVVINPNGGWSWFGDERAVIDAQRNVLYVGSLANKAGAGGAEKDGDVEVTRVNLATGKCEIDVLRDALTSYGGGDDHNVPSLLILPDGRCLAAYTGHNNYPRTHVRIFDPERQQWSDEQTFDWNAAIPGGCDFGCTYNNLFYLPGEGAILNISRNHHRCPNVIVSRDMGATWKYAGQLIDATAVDGATGFYVNGYLKYSQQGDRIDLLSTERHPRNYSTSLFHGYLEHGALHRADGKVVDPTLDASPKADATELTTMFKSGQTVDGTVMNHAWMADIERYPDGTVATVIKVRANGSMDDHRFFYGVFRDGSWTCTPLAKAGPRLFEREEDYTGLAALDPNDPGTVYISTPIEPATDRKLAHHEIYQGKSGDAGATWQWRAVTKDSTADNLRPIVSRWAPGRTAVIWNRGTMTTSQRYDQEVVLVVDPFEGK